jgi:hypothetical protein
MDRVLNRQSRDWWNTAALALLAVIVFFLIWLSACSSGGANKAGSNQTATNTSNATGPTAKTSQANTSGQSVPTSLANAGEYGENIYDYAKANDWKNAGVKLAALKDAAGKVRTEVKNKSAAVDRLDGQVAALDRAVAAKDRQATMREANQVTLDVANMTAAYKLSVPVDVVKLDYYGRELEVWAQAQDPTKLQATAADMRRTWDSLRPSIQAHSATEAKKFETLVAQVESAKTSADYARAAAPVLNEVDNLEKLFP